MKLRTTFLLLAVVAGLFAFVKYYKWPTTRELEEQKGRVVQTDRNQIDGITITNNESKIELRKRDGQWFVDAPVKDRADAGAVSQLLGTIEMLKADHTIQAGEKGVQERIRDFGLATPAVRLKLLGKNAPPEILFGKDAAVEGKVYARIENADTIYVIDSELKNQVTKKANDYRDHRLTGLNTAQIGKVEIHTPAGAIGLVKTAGHWRIEKPLNTQGDDAKIEDLIAKAVNTRIETFVPENEAKAAATGLAEPLGTVSLYVEGGDKPDVLQIGQPLEKDREKLYAKLSTRDGVYVLQKGVAEILNSKPNDLRDTHLLRFNLDTVDRIRIEPEGREKILLARREEGWILKSAGDRPANSAEVRRLAANLHGQEIASFVADSASDLKKYGLDKPQLKLTLSAYASENTAETKAGEKPIASVLFGRIEGDNVFAKLDDEPFVVAVNKSILDAVATDPGQWRDLAVFQFKPEEIATIEVTRPDRPPLTIARSKGEWNFTQGEGELNKINAESLVNTLASLRAVRWIGATIPAHGLDKPTLTLRFTTTGKKSRSLAIGSRTPEEVWFASVDGQPGTFILSGPDESALRIQLTKTLAPKTAPKP